jgi:replicative DNA helicase
MEAEKKIVALNNNTVASDIKKLPYNIEAEQFIVGAILNNNEVINKVADFLLPDHFYEPIHQKIYSAITNLYDKGIIANPVTLKNHFHDDEAMEHAGGANYLLRVCSMAGGIVNLRDYGLIVYNLSISRNLIDIGQELLDDAYKASGNENATAQIEKPESKLFNLASAGNSETNFAPARISLTNALKIADLASKRDGSISGIATKFNDLDNLLGGFNRSDLLILAARPSMGKTALALNLALNAAEILRDEYHKKLEQFRGQQNELEEAPKCGTVGVISLEMSAEQLATRLLSIKTDINASDIRRGKLSKTAQHDDFSKLVKASAELQDLPIFIDDTPALSISAIRTRARRLKRKHNLEFLIIDYLQLIRGVNKKSQESRVQEISEITMGLKALAKELDIPVLALSQLSRQVEQRTDHRPQLSDLRESGSIEQDADIVMFIYREAYYKEREKPSEDNLEMMQKWQEMMGKIDNISEIMVAKNRNGPINNIRLFFDKNTTRFENLANNYGGSSYQE